MLTAGPSALLRFVAGLPVLLVVGLALAHTRLVAPRPRNDQDGYKNFAGQVTEANPCGTPRTDVYLSQNTYREGQTIPVRWEETVDHRGCFIFSLLLDGDRRIVNLYRENDPTDPPGQIPKIRDAGVKLPDGVVCERCTLQLQQVMDNRPCPPATTPWPMVPATSVSTYFSCADIRITYADGGIPPGAPPVDAGASTEGGGPSHNGETGSRPDAGRGVTDPPQAVEPAGRDEVREPDPQNSGCSVPPANAVPRTARGAMLLLVGFALARRARRLRR